jgi:hypothetical protein
MYTGPGIGTGKIHRVVSLPGMFKTFDLDTAGDEVATWSNEPVPANPGTSWLGPVADFLRYFRPLA